MLDFNIFLNSRKGKEIPKGIKTRKMKELFKFIRAIEQKKCEVEKFSGGYSVFWKSSSLIVFEFLGKVNFVFYDEFNQKVLSVYYNQKNGNLEQVDNLIFHQEDYITKKVFLERFSTVKNVLFSNMFITVGDGDELSNLGRGRRVGALNKEEEIKNFFNEGVEKLDLDSILHKYNLSLHLKESEDELGKYGSEKKEHIYSEKGGILLRDIEKKMQFIYERESELDVETKHEFNKTKEKKLEKLIEIYSELSITKKKENEQILLDSLNGILNKLTEIEDSIEESKERDFKKIALLINEDSKGE